MTRLLLAGETAVVVQQAAVGASVSVSARQVSNAGPFLDAMAGAGVAVDHLAGERCEAGFPATERDLAAYSAVILSDVGALSLLLTPESRAGHVGPDRLALLARWVETGGALMMAGGYMSFQGLHGQALWAGTVVDDILPVVCQPHADGVEAPAGLIPRVVTPHPITRALPAPLPPILGLNRVALRPEGHLLMVAEDDRRSLPLLAVRRIGRGRTLAWMTDIGPHWLSRPFLDGAAYPALMTAMVRWLATGA